MKRTPNPRDPEKLAEDMLRQLEAADKEEKSRQAQADREALAQREQKAQHHQLIQAVKSLELRHTALPEEIAKLDTALTTMSEKIAGSLKQHADREAAKRQITDIVKQRRALLLEQKNLPERFKNAQKQLADFEASPQEWIAKKVRQEKEAQERRVERDWTLEEEIARTDRSGHESDAEKAQRDWQERYDRVNKNDPYGGINPDHDPYGL